MKPLQDYKLQIAFENGEVRLYDAKPMIQKPLCASLREPDFFNQARAEYKKSQAELESTKNTIYLNVEKNYIDLQTDMEAIVIAKLALDQAKEQYRQVTGRYKAGVGDAIELKDGENTYLNARLDFYNAVLNYNVTAASLEKEIGLPLTMSEEMILKISPEDI